MQRGDDVMISISGAFSIAVNPDDLITLTNTVGQMNG